MEAMVARSAVQSGEFKYKIIHYAKPGSEFEWKREGHFAFDEKLGQIMHSFTFLISSNAETPNPFGAVPGSSNGVAVQRDDGIEYRGGGLFSRDERSAVVFPVQAPEGKIVVLTSALDSPLLYPFDYRSFGFAFYGDVERNVPFDKILANYLKADDAKITELKEGDIPASMGPKKKGARYFNYGGYYMCLEDDRDYWVTRGQLITSKYKKLPDGTSEKIGEEVSVSCELTLNQINGHWLPEGAMYKSGDRRLQFRLEWLNVNPPPGKIKMSTEAITVLVGKSLVGVN